MKIILYSLFSFRIKYFVKDYETPESNFLDMDTTHKTEEESLNEILNVYR